MNDITKRAEAEAENAKIETLIKAANKAILAWGVDDSVAGPDTTEYDNAVSDPELILKLCLAYKAQAQREASTEQPLETDIGLDEHDLADLAEAKADIAAGRVVSTVTDEKPHTCSGCGAIIAPGNAAFWQIKAFFSDKMRSFYISRRALEAAINGEKK